MNVRADWTFEQAQAAQQGFQAQGGSANDPTGPLYQWVALVDVEQRLRSRYDSGEKYALMLAIRKCANHDLVMPAWVSSAYINAFDTVNNYRAKSWDEVFEKPLPKSARLAALRKRHKKSVHVWNEVTKRHQMGMPIDDSLFQSVGEQLGLGLTLTKEYYAEWSARTRMKPGWFLANVVHGWIALHRSRTVDAE